MIFNGFINMPVWGYLLLVMVLTHITIISVTLFLHRYQAHRALTMHPLLSHFFRFWLWLTTGIVTKEWVAIHRKHHAKCETAEDPHSPQVKGLSEVLWRGTELYRAEARNQQTLTQYGRGTPDDWLERHLYQRHSSLGVALLAALMLLLFGAAGLAIWAVQMLWIPFWAAGVINGIGHFWGYRNFEIPNAATNIVPWGILIGGEELHNNHHAFSSSAKLSFRRWEFDLGWFYLRLFALLRLAKVHKVAPKRKLAGEHAQLDLEVIKALTVNRLQLLADYGREVLRPVFRQEMDKRQKRLYRAVQRLARRDQGLLSEADRQRLNQVLEQNTVLQTVYQFKLRLQAVWEQQALTHDMRLGELRQWCAQAEASGIEALQRFVHLVRSYEMVPQRR